MGGVMVEEFGDKLGPVGVEGENLGGKLADE
jgi:hypothetical protein